eukprot:GFUD01085110.1.p1 GENE.GFUD01085110.1~~GFUD01085110.1.p1  ORF type:complete len:123 (+),score=28.46 GFUD01085110.1:41-409(+)
MGAFKVISFLVFVMVASLATGASASSAGNRRLLEDDDINTALDDAKEGFTSFIDSFWGGSCSSQEQCVDYIATCASNGECRPSWWVWMIMVFIVLSLLASCICCICCGICSCIIDCCCCCFR